RAQPARVDRVGLAWSGRRGRLRPARLPSQALAQGPPWLAARPGLSQRLASVRQPRAAAPLAAEALTPAIEGLERQLKRLERQLERATHPAPELAPTVAALETVPGSGPVTAAAVAACRVNQRFTPPEQVVASVGLDSRVSQSGRRRGQFGLSTQGDAELRRLLDLAAMAAAHSPHDPTCAERY